MVAPSNTDWSTSVNTLEQLEWNRSTEVYTPGSRLVRPPGTVKVQVAFSAVVTVTVRLRFRLCTFSPSWLWNSRWAERNGCSPSLDQFVVSYFLATPGVSTLPVEIYSAIRKGFTPEINAVSTLLLGASVGLFAVFAVLTGAGEKR